MLRNTISILQNATSVGPVKCGVFFPLLSYELLGLFNSWELKMEGVVISRDQNPGAIQAELMQFLGSFHTLPECYLATPAGEFRRNK